MRYDFPQNERLGKTWEVNENPYRTPANNAVETLRYCNLRATLRRYAAGICTINTCASCLCFFFLLLPAAPVMPAELLVWRTLGWWHLVGLPLTTSFVIWSLLCGHNRVREHLRLIIWCVMLLLLWLAFAGFAAVVVISEAGLFY